MTDAQPLRRAFPSPRSRSHFRSLSVVPIVARPFSCSRTPYSADSDAGFSMALALPPQQHVACRVCVLGSVCRASGHVQVPPSAAALWLGLNASSVGAASPGVTGPSAEHLWASPGVTGPSAERPWVPRGCLRSVRGPVHGPSPITSETTGLGTASCPAGHVAWEPLEGSSEGGGC